MPTNHSNSSAMLRPSRVTDIRAAATSVNPCTGARSAPSHGTSVAADLPGRRPPSGAQNTGFAGYSRQAGPVRPVYNTDQPITALRGTGIRTTGPSQDGALFRTASSTPPGYKTVSRQMTRPETDRWFGSFLLRLRVCLTGILRGLEAAQTPSCGSRLPR